VTDLLADIRHFCSERDLDFTRLLERGTEHYEVECGKRPEIGLEVLSGEMACAEDSESVLEKRGSAAPDGGHTLPWSAHWYHSTWLVTTARGDSRRFCFCCLRSCPERLTVPAGLSRGTRFVFKGHPGKRTHIPWSGGPCPPPKARFSVNPDPPARAPPSKEIARSGTFEAFRWPSMCSQIFRGPGLVRNLRKQPSETGCKFPHT
jgi:hypothetical protein